MNGVEDSLFSWELELRRRCCSNIIKNGVDCTIHSTMVDTSGRYLILKVEIEDKIIIYSNIYLCKYSRNSVLRLQSVLIINGLSIYLTNIYAANKDRSRCISSKHTESFSRRKYRL